MPKSKKKFEEDTLNLRFIENIDSRQNLGEEMN